MTRNVVRSFLCFRSARPKNGLARRPQSKTPHTLAWLCDELRESTRLRAPWKINQPPIPEEIMSEIGRIIDRGKWSLEALSVIGTRMLRNQLNREGVMVGRKHVRTRMARMGMEALYRKPGTSKKHPGHEIYPYLLRGLTINRANQVWALDTTYIPMANGQRKHQQRLHLKNSGGCSKEWGHFSTLKPTAIQSYIAIPPSLGGIVFAAEQGYNSPIYK